MRKIFLCVNFCAIAFLASCQQDMKDDGIRTGYQTYDEAFSAGMANKKAGKYAEAVSDFQSAASITRQSHNISACLWEINECYWVQHKWLETAQCCRKIYETPNGWEHLAWRARVREAYCYYLLKDYQKALPLLIYVADKNNYVEGGGGYYLVDANLLVCNYYWQNKEYEKAQKFLDFLITDKYYGVPEKTRSRAMRMKGEYLYRESDYPSALKYFREYAGSATGKSDKTIMDQIKKCENALTSKYERKGEFHESGK